MSVLVGYVVDEGEYCLTPCPYNKKHKIVDRYDGPFTVRSKDGAGTTNLVGSITCKRCEYHVSQKGRTVKCKYEEGMK